MDTVVLTSKGAGEVTPSAVISSYYRGLFFPFLELNIYQSPIVVCKIRSNLCNFNLISGHNSLVPDIRRASPLRLLYEGEALRLYAGKP